MSTQYMYFKSIQFLRCIAAIYITCFHIMYWWNQQQDEFTGLFDNGYGAIDLFFVISGFVVVQSAFAYRSGWYPFLVFLKKRLVRIYPMYWLLLLVFILTGIVDISQKTGLQRWQTAFLLPGHPPVIAPSWTLVYELYFYILISLLVLNKRFKYLLAAVCLLSLVSLATQLTATTTPYWRLPAMGIYNEFVTEFFMGIVAWRIFKKVRFAWALIFAVAGAVLFFFPIKLFPSHVISFGIPSALLIIGLTALEMQGKLQVPRMIVMLGDASYCLYLIHAPVSSLLLPYPAAPYATNRWLLAGIVAGLVVLAVPLHLFIEKPLLQFLNRLLLPETGAIRNASKKDKGGTLLPTGK